MGGGGMHMGSPMGMGGAPGMMMHGSPFGGPPPPPAGRTLRNYADLDAPAEGSFIPNYGMLLTPHEAAVAAGEAPPETKRKERRSRRSPSRSRSRSKSRSPDKDKAKAADE